MVSNWHQPWVFCEGTLPQKIDFSLWTADLQTQSCFQAIDAAKEAIGNPFSQQNTNCLDVDAPTCDPCGKTLDALFGIYSSYFKNAVVASLDDI